MKIPCIECNKKMWEYIKPYLDKWKYVNKVDISQWEKYPLLVINSCGSLGLCTNYSISHNLHNSRELVTDVEEFLERAAQLKGFKYKKEMKEFKKSDLKPGMVVEYDDGRRRIVLKDSNDNLFLASDNCICSLISFNNNLINERHSDLTINKIYEIDSICNIDCILEGEYLKLIWERPQTVELTLQEIAEKFNVPVETIRIKEN